MLGFYENISIFEMNFLQILTLVSRVVSAVKQYFKTSLSLTIRIASYLEFLTGKIALI
jgi:hypothetical protein